MRPTALLLLVSPLAVATAQQSSTSTPAGTGVPVLTVEGVDFHTWREYLDSDLFRVRGLRCGIPGREERLASQPAQFRNPSDCSSFLTSILPQYEPDGGIVYEVPVVFHVLSSTAGAGNMSSQRIIDNVEILNEDFRALPGTPGAPGTDVRIHFYLATVDPNGNPTNGIDRVTNNTWFGDSGNYWDPLAWDPTRYLNVYTNQASGALGYVPDLPQGGIAGLNVDRVVILYSAVGRNAPIGPPYDQGRTLTHEVGHYFGLEHTFSGGCGTPLCYESGDLICDTNPEGSPTFGCPGGKSTCGLPDPISNYMDYSDDLCYSDFTPEQANRMRCTIENYRPNLGTPICPGTATSVVRNGGANPTVFASTLPIVADRQTLTISTAPYSLVKVFGYAAGGSLTLSGGQALLVDLTSPRYFQLGPAAGPKATLEFLVPHDVDLCGVSFSMQALLYGGASPFALTNAIDQTVGRAP